MRGGSELSEDVDMYGSSTPDQDTMMADVEEHDEDKYKEAQMERKKRLIAGRRDYDDLRWVLKSIRGLSFTGVDPAKDAFPTIKSSTVFLNSHSHKYSPNFTVKLNNREDWLNSISDLFKNFGLYEAEKTRAGWYVHDEHAWLADLLHRLGTPESLSTHLAFAIRDLMTKVVQARVRYWKKYWKGTSFSVWDERCRTRPRRPVDYDFTSAVDNYLRYLGKECVAMQFAAHFTPIAIHTFRRGHGPKQPHKKDQEFGPDFNYRFNPTQVSMIDIAQYVYWMSDIDSGTTVLTEAQHKFFTPLMNEFFPQPKWWPSVFRGWMPRVTERQ